MSEPKDPGPNLHQIYVRADRDRALDEGWLARADIDRPLHHIAVLDFGEPGSAGYDEDGFFTSLVADAIRVEGIVDFIVHSNDHNPPHVHVQPHSQRLEAVCAVVARRI